MGRLRIFLLTVTAGYLSGVYASVVDGADAPDAGIQRTAALYKEMARRFTRDEKSSLKSAAHWEEQAAIVRRIGDSKPEQQRGQYRDGEKIYARTAAYCRRHATYYDRLRRKYEYAAEHPELPVDSDPPHPKP